jgi:hypothetical protein
MRRTTIYLEPEIEVLLKLEAMRRKTPMSEILREALRSHLGRKPAGPPPGAGAFESGRKDTAERAEALLEESRFGKKR